MSSEGSGKEEREGKDVVEDNVADCSGFVYDLRRGVLVASSNSCPNEAKQNSCRTKVSIGLPNSWPTATGLFKQSNLYDRLMCRVF